MSTDTLPPTHRYWILDRTRTRIWLSRREIVLLALLVLQVLVMLGARIDKTWELSRGIGFSEHYGFFTIFAITPLVLLLTGYALETFVATISDIDTYCTTSDERTRGAVAELSRRHVGNLALRSYNKSHLSKTAIGREM